MYVMKTALILKNSFFMLLATLMATTGSLAQSAQRKTDKVYLLSGEVREGKVLAMSAGEAQFTYPGETLPYTFSKNTIHKIVFASGREEVLNAKAPATAGAPAASLAYRPQTVAVLPLFYSGEGSDLQTEGMRYRLQQEVYQYLSRNALGLRYQDPAETNALLLKNGVDETTIRRYTQAELAALLQVEYLVSGAVTQQTGNISQHTNSSTTSSARVGQDGHRKVNVKERGQTYAMTTTQVEIKTTVDLAVSTVGGERLYSDSRRSILTSGDAYRNSLHYMLKRSPLYAR
jgi:hypothetical protein